VSILDQLIPEPGAFYVMDRGFLDYARLYRFHQAGSFFVTRARANMDYRRRYSHPVNQDTGVISDQTIIFSGRHAQGDFPAILREPGGWRSLYGVCVLAIFTHIAGDWITSFGTMVFAPLSDWRAGIGTTFIIDLWFSGIILAGLLLSASFRRTRIPAVAASVALCAYVGFQYLQKEKALDFARGHAAERGLAGADVAAYPRAISPFNWTVYVSDAREHRYAHINLVREAPRAYAPGDGFAARLDSAFRPLAMARWETRSRYGDDPLGREAWEAPPLAFFRWFAEMPAFDGRTERPTCIWFLDLRFLNPGRDWVPFRFGACRDDSHPGPGSPWRAYVRDYPRPVR
jgi:inner membrane protein